MKKIICVLLALLVAFSAFSVGLTCFAADEQPAATTEYHPRSDSDAPFDLTKTGGGEDDHTTLWRIIAQFWVEVYYFYAFMYQQIKSLF